MKKFASALILLIAAVSLFANGSKEAGMKDGAKHYKFGFTCMDQSNPFFVLIEIDYKGLFLVYKYQDYQVL